MKQQRKQFKCIKCQKEFRTRNECILHETEFQHHSYDLKNSKLRLHIG